MRIVFCTGSLETIPSNPQKPNLTERFVCSSKNGGSSWRTKQAYLLIKQQKEGWQAILNKFAKHVEAKQ